MTRLHSFDAAAKPSADGCRSCLRNSDDVISARGSEKNTNEAGYGVLPGIDREHATPVVSYYPASRRTQPFRPAYCWHVIHRGQPVSPDGLPAISPVWLNKYTGPAGRGSRTEAQAHLRAGDRSLWLRQNARMGAASGAINEASNPGPTLASRVKRTFSRPAHLTGMVVIANLHSRACLHVCHFSGNDRNGSTYSQHGCLPGARDGKARCGGCYLRPRRQSENPTSPTEIEFPAKLTDIEAQRMRAKSVRIPAHRLKRRIASARLDTSCRSKRIAGSPLDDRFQSAPRAISDRWAPRRRQFKRSHSEILFAGKQEGTAFTCIPSGFII